MDLHDADSNMIREAEVRLKMSRNLRARISSRVKVSSNDRAKRNPPWAAL